MKDKYNITSQVRKQEENKKVIYNLHGICKEHGWKHIGVLSSTKYKMEKTVKMLEHTTKELGMQEYQFEEICPILIYADALNNVQKCDAVLLVEKYNYTKYSEFEETLRVLKEYKINIVGVITV